MVLIYKSEMTQPYEIKTRFSDIIPAATTKCTETASVTALRAIPGTQQKKRVPLEKPAFIILDKICGYFTTIIGVRLQALSLDK